MVKMFFAARVTGNTDTSGYLVQKANCVVFTPDIAKATLYSTEDLLHEALERYEFDDALVLEPVPVLTVDDPTAKTEVRLSLVLHIDNKVSELFSISLNQSKAEILAKANSVSTVLESMFGG